MLTEQVKLCEKEYPNVITAKFFRLAMNLYSLYTLMTYPYTCTSQRTYFLSTMTEVATLDTAKVCDVSLYCLVYIQIL